MPRRPLPRIDAPSTIANMVPAVCLPISSLVSAGTREYESRGGRGRQAAYAVSCLGGPQSKLGRHAASKDAAGKRGLLTCSVLEREDRCGSRVRFGWMTICRLTYHRQCEAHLRAIAHDAIVFASILPLTWMIRAND